MQAVVEIKHTPKEIAELIWGMGSDEQAEMLHQLHEVAGGEHNLMMQFMWTRDECEDRLDKDWEDKALAGFQALASSAYKYILGG